VGELVNYLRAALPDTSRPPKVSIKKRTAADATFADVRFKILTQLNDGTPIYWYFRRQNGSAVPNLGGVRCYGCYLDRDQVTDAAAADFVAGGTMELAACVGPTQGSITFVGTTHGHEGDWTALPVFKVDGVAIDYGSAALNTTWSGDEITCTFSYPVYYADDTGPWCSITRTIKATRAGIEITQTRTLLLATWVGDSEYVGQIAVNIDGSGTTAEFDAIAVDTGNGGDGETGMGPLNANYEYARTQGMAFFGQTVGHDYIALTSLAEEIPASRLAAGFAAYVTDRTDSNLKAYHVQTNGNTGGVLWSPPDVITAVMRYQVYKATSDVRAKLGEYLAGTWRYYGTTTSAAIRDLMATTLAAVTPESHAHVKFRQFREDHSSAFRDWCNANPQGCERKFSIRDRGGASAPMSAGGLVEWVERDFEVVIAYPRMWNPGSQGALDLDDVIEADERLVAKSIGTHGYSSLVSATTTANATVIHADASLERTASCVFLVLPMSVSYLRSIGASP